MKNKRELFWDIIKGIGIISIVIGHVVSWETPRFFVYMYHLAIFYFVSAYFYNEKKYGDNPTRNFAERFTPNWLRYVFYSIILMLLHNIFVKYNFLAPGTGVYSKIEEIIPPVLNTLVFFGSELFAGAMWFVPTLIYALTIFGIIVYWSRKISNIVQDERKKKIIKYIFIIILSIMSGMVGVFLNTRKLELIYNLHTSFLILPICAVGYFLREYKNIIKVIKKSYVAIPTVIVTAAIILYAIIKKGYQIELSDERIINVYMFYIITFIGIAFCLSLAAIIEKVPILNKVTALLGKHSFAIMALHFASVKLVDVIYSKIINETNPVIISKWVVSYPEKLWWIYIIVGCTLPLVFSVLMEKIKTIKIIKSIKPKTEEQQPQKQLEEPKEEIVQC